MKRLQWGVAIVSATVLIAGLTFSGCGSDDVVVIGPDSPAIRIMHLSSDAPDVDAYLNAAAQIASGVAFTEGSAYARVPEGVYSLSVVEAGSPATPSVLTVGPFALTSGAAYTAVAFNELAAPIQGMLLEDDLSDPGAGNIRFRTAHTAPGVGQVDIWDVTDAENPSPLYTDVDFGVAGDYVVRPAGSYTIGLDVDDDQVMDFAFETGSLAEGSIITLFVVNDADGVFLIAQQANGETTRIDPNA